MEKWTESEIGRFIAFLVICILVSFLSILYLFKLYNREKDQKVKEILSLEKLNTDNLRKEETKHNKEVKEWIHKWASEVKNRDSIISDISEVMDYLVEVIENQTEVIEKIPTEAIIQLLKKRCDNECSNRSKKEDSN